MVIFKKKQNKHFNSTPIFSEASFVENNLFLISHKKFFGGFVF